MRIAIDLGHGVGQDRGAMGIISEESVINAVGTLVINKLQKLGHAVITTRPSNASSVSDSLSKRVHISNINNVDLFVSLHCNVTPGGYGTEVYTYNGRDLKEAVRVLNNICALGYKNRGIKPSNKVAYVVNHTNAPAMLVEMMFVDSQGDINTYNRVGAKGIADAIVKGITGTTVETAETPNKPIETKVSTNLRDWQSAFNNTYGTNISVDGIRGPQTEASMRGAIIKQGSSNPLVAWLQCRIGANIDGVFGPRTKASLVAYQLNHGLTGDGVAGFNTWNSLFNNFYW